MLTTTDRIDAALRHMTTAERILADAITATPTAPWGVIIPVMKAAIGELLDTRNRVAPLDTTRANTP